MIKSKRLIHLQRGNNLKQSTVNGDFQATKLKWGWAIQEKKPGPEGKKKSGLYVKKDFFYTSRREKKGRKRVRTKKEKERHR